MSQMVSSPGPWGSYNLAQVESVLQEDLNVKDIGGMVCLSPPGFTHKCLFLCFLHWAGVPITLEAVRKVAFALRSEISKLPSKEELLKMICIPVAEEEAEKVYASGWVDALRESDLTALEGHLSQLQWFLDNKDKSCPLQRDDEKRDLGIGCGLLLSICFGIRVVIRWRDMGQFISCELGGLQFRHVGELVLIYDNGHYHLQQSSARAPADVMGRVRGKMEALANGGVAQLAPAPPAAASSAPAAAPASVPSLPAASGGAQASAKAAAHLPLSSGSPAGVCLGSPLAPSAAGHPAADPAAAPAAAAVDHKAGTRNKKRAYKEAKRVAEDNALDELIAAQLAKDKLLDDIAVVPSVNPSGGIMVDGEVATTTVASATASLSELNNLRALLSETLKRDPSSVPLKTARCISTWTPSTGSISSPSFQQALGVLSSSRTAAHLATFFSASQQPSAGSKCTYTNCPLNDASFTLGCDSLCCSSCCTCRRCKGRVVAALQSINACPKDLTSLFSSAPEYQHRGNRGSASGGGGVAGGGAANIGGGGGGGASAGAAVRVAASPRLQEGSGMRALLSGAQARYSALLGEEGAGGAVREAAPPRVQEQRPAGLVGGGGGSGGAAVADSFAFDYEPDAASSENEGTAGSGMRVLLSGAHKQLEGKYSALLDEEGAVALFSAPLWDGEHGCPECADAMEGTLCTHPAQCTFAILRNASMPKKGSGAELGAVSGDEPGAEALQLARSHVVVRLPQGKLPPFCSSCDSYSILQSCMTSTPCIHKGVCTLPLLRKAAGAPRRAAFPFEYTSLSTAAPSAAPSSSSAASSSCSMSPLPPPSASLCTIAIRLPPLPRHVSLVILPLRCPAAPHFSLAPSVVTIPNTSTASNPRARCSICVTGGSKCPHSKDAITAAEHFTQGPRLANRSSEFLKPPQSTTQYPFNLRSAEAYPRPPCFPAGNLHPGNGGGTFDKCPQCSAMFLGSSAESMTTQCPLYIFTPASDGTAEVSLRNMLYQHCSTAGCTGKNYYDGISHNIVVISSAPYEGPGGRQKTRAWAVSAQFLLQLMRNGVSESQTWAKVYEHFFKNKEYPTRFDFTAAMQRALMYLVPLPKLRRLGHAVVVDVTQTTGTLVPPLGRFGGSTSVSPPHVCLPDSASACVARGTEGHMEGDNPSAVPFVNPENPLFGMAGDELSALTPGISALPNDKVPDLTVDDVRLLLHRLALSAAKNLPHYSVNTLGVLGFGTLSDNGSAGQRINPIVTVRELRDMAAALRKWCSGVIPAEAPAPGAGERTCTAVTLALSLSALLPLLDALPVAPLGDTVQVPGCLALLFLSYQSPAVCSAVCRLPEVGAHFFQALVTHLESRGTQDATLDATVPDAVAAPIPGGPTLRHALHPFVPAMWDPSASPAPSSITWRAGLTFFSPELASAFLCAAELRPPLLPILQRYGQLAAKVSHRELRMLLNAPPPDGEYPPQIGKQTQYDTLWRHSVPVEATAKDEQNPLHGVAQRILHALQFQEGGEDLPQIDAQSGLYISGLGYIRKGPLHYLNTHGLSEHSDCSNCARSCSSRHCTESRDSREEGKGGCSHSFSAMGRLGGSMTLACPDTGQVHGFVISQHHESLRLYFSLFNGRSTVERPSWEEGPLSQGHPFVIIFDAACQLAAYFLRRNPQQFKRTLFFVDSFHSSDHKAAACQGHLHIPLWKHAEGATGISFKNVYDASAEGFHSVLLRVTYATSAVQSSYAHHAQKCGYYSGELRERSCDPSAGGRVAKPFSSKAKISTGFPPAHSHAASILRAATSPSPIQALPGVQPHGDPVPFAAPRHLYSPPPSLHQESVQSGAGVAASPVAPSATSALAPGQEYTCIHCGRVFKSGRALGGHTGNCKANTGRARKPSSKMKGRVQQEDELKEEEEGMEGEEEGGEGKKSKPNAFQCKACKVVFSSGQALGGHRGACKKNAAKGGMQGAICSGTESSGENGTRSEEEASSSGNEDSSSSSEKEDGSENEDSSSSSETDDEAFRRKRKGPSKRKVPPRKRTRAKEHESGKGKKSKPAKTFSCELCKAVFGSGQALGGHKGGCKKPADQGGRMEEKASSSGSGEESNRSEKHSPSRSSSGDPAISVSSSSLPHDSVLKVDFPCKLMSPWPLAKASVRVVHLSCLQPKGHLNDTVVSFWMTLLWHRATTSIGEREHIAFLSSQLYNFMLKNGGEGQGEKVGGGASSSSSALQAKKPSPQQWTQHQYNVAYAAVSKWNTKIPVFTMAALLTPINIDHSNHWSLLAVINAPSLHAYLFAVNEGLQKVAEQTKEAKEHAIAAVSLPPLPTVLLHADSLPGHHQLDDLGLMFQEWLLRLWRDKHNNGKPIGGTQEAENCLRDFKVRREGAPEVSLLHALMPRKKLQVAQQNNGYDCGLHMLRAAEALLEMMRGPWAVPTLPQAPPPPWASSGLLVQWPPSVPQHGVSESMDSTRAFMVKVFQCLFNDSRNIVDLSVCLTEVEQGQEGKNAAALISEAWPQASSGGESQGFMVRKAKAAI